MFRTTYVVKLSFNASVDLTVQGPETSPPPTPTRNLPKSKSALFGARAWQMKATMEIGATRIMLFFRPKYWPITPPTMQVKMLAKVTRLAERQITVSKSIFFNLLHKNLSYMTFIHLKVICIFNFYYGDWLTYFIDKRNSYQTTKSLQQKDRIRF